MLGNKVALITGASNGIGLEIARKFSQNGWDVIAVARNEEKLSKAVEDLKQYGTKIIPYSIDLSKYEQIETLVMTPTY
ncbi:SDR family NAD(P)-dependent oxidoreductase [Klebsiella pneumoniae]|nr:SDR family NAD(P)-dependent oxidoreductase [Klebsiella pneumoniae]